MLTTLRSSAVLFGACAALSGGALSGCASSSTTPSAPTLAFLEGEWVGELVYLDYQDNTSEVTLPVSVGFAPSGDASFAGSYVYTEPNGSKVSSDGPIAIVDGELVIGEVGLPIVSFTPSEIVSEGPGEDAGKAATVRVELRHTLGDDIETVNMIKWIEPNDGSKRYWRNRYALRRR